LSFAAVAALLAVGAQAGHGAATVFAGSQAAVTIALTPVVAVVFGLVFLVSPLVNAVAIPLLSAIILPATLLTIAALPLSPDLGAWRFRTLAGSLLLPCPRP
jgi:competence protein ComEC